MRQRGTLAFRSSIARDRSTDTLVTANGDHSLGTLGYDEEECILITVLPKS